MAHSVLAGFECAGCRCFALQVMELAELLVRKYDESAWIRRLVDSRQIVLMPMANAGTLHRAPELAARVRHINLSA